MKAKLLPDINELNRLFYIDTNLSNGLRWRISVGRRGIKDSPVGCEHHTGYYVTHIKRIYYNNHRIIYSIFHNLNLSEEQFVDHIDRNKHNNHPNNLRIVTKSENNRNVTKRKSTSSEYIGVSFQKRDKKFQAYIQVNKKYTYIGYYDSEIEAATAYNNYIINNNLTHFNLNKI